MATEKDSPVSASEAKSLFSDLEACPALLLAVSGGPDSIALMVLAARWRQSLKRKPVLIVATVDHGLRAEAKREAAAVAKLARSLGLKHRTLAWTGTKPKTGLQQAAREARYRLLADAARKAGASHILTAHTLDDQAETVMIRMSRGSGMTGLAAMQKIAVIPGRELRGPGAAPRTDEPRLLRPLLGIPKMRLIATLRAEDIPFAVDPSNRDPRFTRARLRGLMPQLAGEGLDAHRLATLARRLKRADLAIEAAVDRAQAELTAGADATFDAAGFARLPDEIALRLIGRAVARLGDEGPVELGKLETLMAALGAAQKAGTARFCRSLAGALVTLARDKISVECAPPRRTTRTVARKLKSGRTSLTKARGRTAQPKPIR